MKVLNNDNVCRLLNRLSRREVEKEYNSTYRTFFSWAVELYIHLDLGLTRSGYNIYNLIDSKKNDMNLFQYWFTLRPNPHNSAFEICKA